MNQSLSNRIVCSAALLAVILLGLLTRSGSPFIPRLVREFGGDALWALAAYLLVRLLAPRLPLLRSAALAVAISFAVEFSQLYQAAWLNQIRNTRAGGLLLGHGFLSSDLLCYLIGVSAGAAIELALQKIVSRKRRAETR